MTADFPATATAAALSCTGFGACFLTRGAVAALPFTRMRLGLTNPAARTDTMRMSISLMPRVASSIKMPSITALVVVVVVVMVVAVRGL